MAWTVSYLDAAITELADQPADIRAHLDRIVALITEHGLEHLPRKLVKHLDGELWEFRLNGRDGIARALYVTKRGQRIVVVRVFTKKTQKTPPREIRLARQRAEEVQ